MKVRINKLHPDAKTPKYAKPGDAGMDLHAVNRSMDEHGNFVYHTGIAMEIPSGHVGFLFPRSSISKTPVFLRNSVGVIDSGYRGEIMFKFAFCAGSGTPYEIGDRIGQIMILPYPEINFVEADSLSETERGSGGFGSTDDSAVNSHGENS